VTTLRRSSGASDAFAAPRNRAGVSSMVRIPVLQYSAVTVLNFITPRSVNELRSLHYRRIVHGGEKHPMRHPISQIEAEVLLTLGSTRRNVTTRHNTNPRSHIGYRQHTGYWGRIEKYATIFRIQTMCLQYNTYIVDVAPRKIRQPSRPVELYVAFMFVSQVLLRAPKTIIWQCGIREDNHIL
jgi:hypothetical protein